MPPIKLFDGQRLGLVAGDDLRGLAKVALALRCLQLLVVAPAALDLFDVQVNKALVWAFWLVSTVNISASLLLESFTFCISSQGSPVEEERRKHLPLLCSVKVFPFSLLSFSSAALGCCLIHQNNRDDNFCAACSQRTQRALLALAYTHIVELVLVVAVMLFLLCQQPVLFRWSLRTKPTIRVEDGWRCVCRWFFACSRCCSCCLLGGSEVLWTSKGASFLTEISVILGEYFDAGGVKVNVTPTDLLAGVSALASEEKRKREKRELKQDGDLESFRPECAIRLSSIATGDFDEDLATSASMDSENDDLVVSPHGTRRRRTVLVKTVHMRRDAWDSKGYFAVAERTRLLPENTTDREVMMDGSRYMRLAHAVYGYVMCATGPSYTTPCAVLSGVLSCKSRSFNEMAFLQLAGVERADLVYLSSRTGIEACPYAIVLDRLKKAVVVVIRGTLSLEDAVTDLNLIPQALSDHANRCPELEGHTGHCHAGILQSVLWIYEDLQHHGLLQQCLDSDSSMETKGYHLVCTGHSLGAGCAAILSIILRKQFRRYAKCLLFSPPGCVMSEDICSQPFMTTYVLDSDVVPRLSVSSLDSLRNDVLESIARIRVPKHLVDRTDVNEILCHPSQIPDSPFYQQLQAFRSHRELSRKARVSERVKLCLPGRSIVHLVKAQVSDASVMRHPANTTNHYYAPVWAERSDFSEITLRKSLMINHLPWRVLHQLNTVAGSFGYRELG